MATARITPITPTTPIAPNWPRNLLDECQQLAATRLPLALEDVLTQADDVLFKLANSADSSKRQDMYFDAMRELRLKRSDIARQFSADCQRQYADLLASAKAPKKAGGLEFSGELSLVGLDEVEETLAISNFAASVKTRCGRELFGLESRLGMLLKMISLADADNPFGPQAIGDALRRACQGLTAAIEVKLTLYKLFDKFAGPSLLQMYVDLNGLLHNAGVLPNLSAAAAPGAPKRRTRVTIESDEQTIEATGEDVYSTLSQLMQSHVAGGATGRSGGVNPTIVNLGGGVGGVGGVGAAASGDFVSVPLLVDTLTQLQRGAGNGTAGSYSGGIDCTQLAVGNVNVLRGLRTSGAIGQMAPSQDMTLEIVSVLFDYILEDRSIPDAIKALIGRLQIPMLKVAILDKGLFSKKAHPARRLLDALAHAALGWYEGLPKSDALYAKMEQVVRCIVAEFDDDVSLFSRVLDDFSAFIEHESLQAAERTESSTRSLRTREQIALAKMAVDSELRTRLHGFDVREFIQNFLFDYWRQLLIISHVEHGPDSDPWRAQLHAVDELVWSVQPKTTPDDRRQLSARLPQMLRSVKAGMLALEMPSPECSKFLSMLASVHVVAIKNIEESSIAARKLTQAPTKAATDVAARSAALNDPTSEEFIKRGLARIFERKATDAPLVLDIDFSAFEAAVEETDEPTVATIADTVDLAQYVAQVTTLDLGDWVEFTADDSSVVRGRFTWISESTGRYLFTNRQGDMMRDITLIELAQVFKAGHAVIIKAEADPLFDRILGELIDKLETEAAA